MIAQEIFEILSAYSNNQAQLTDFALVPLYENIKDKINAGEKL